MKCTSLSFIQSFLFDPEYHEMVTNLIHERGHTKNARVLWKRGLPPVPTDLYCTDDCEKSIWILIRNLGDVELRTVKPLDPSEQDVEFDRMPVGVQRGIIIPVYKDTSVKVSWQLFQNPVDQIKTSAPHVINTHVINRKRCNNKRPYEHFVNLK